MTKKALTEPKYELFINDHSHGQFLLWTDALREAEYLIGETDIDPVTVQDIAIRTTDHEL